jgi:predicted NBD/HSP70 family sugar kinase
LHRTGARRVTLEALLSATRRAVAERVGLGGDIPSDRLNATIAQRAPSAAEALARAERELEGASASEANVLNLARRLHDLAYPLSAGMKESA